MPAAPRGHDAFQHETVMESTESVTIRPYYAQSRAPDAPFRGFQRKWSRANGRAIARSTRTAPRPRRQDDRRPARSKGVKLPLDSSGSARMHLAQALRSRDPQAPLQPTDARPLR